MATPALILLPDAERALVEFLRRQAELVALIGDRVYTAFPPKAGGDPLVVCRRFGGEPPVPRPLVLDAALIQCDAYGGTKAQAWEVIATIRAACSLRGGLDAGSPASTVRALRYVPDETWDPPRPRYVADIEVYVRPAPPAAAPLDPSASAPPADVLDPPMPAARAGR